MDKPPPYATEVIPFAGSRKVTSEAKHVASDKRSFISYVQISKVEFKPLTWIWDSVIPRCEVSMIAGEGGLGKSQIAVSMASVITTGGQWPCSREYARQGNVVFVSTEDSIDRVIGPRLAVAGADTSRCYAYKVVVDYDDNGRPVSRGLDLQRDVERLDGLLTEIGNVELVVFDPIMSFLGKADAKNPSEARVILDNLDNLAERHHSGSLLINHLNKSQGASARARVSGSVNFVNACRSVYGVIESSGSDSPRELLPIKNNYASDDIGFTYEIRKVYLEIKDKICEYTKIVWHEMVNKHMEEALMPGDEREGPKLSKAEDFLLETLKTGEVPTKQIRKLAKAENIASRTLERAKTTLEINAFRKQGIWHWRMPNGTYASD